MYENVCTNNAILNAYQFYSMELRHVYTNSAMRHSLDFAFNKCHNIKKHKLARNQCQEMADEREMF